MDTEQAAAPATTPPLAWLDGSSRIYVPGGPEGGVDWLAECRKGQLRDGDDMLPALKRFAPGGVLATEGGGLSELRYHPEEELFGDPPPEDPGRDPVRAEADDRRLVFIASTETPDRHGTIIRVAGWIVDNFLKNPVILWNHDRSKPPIGRAEAVKAVGKKLLVPVEFAPPDLGDGFGYSIYRYYVTRFLSACSVAFRALESFYNAKLDAVEFTKTELLDLSAVAVPSNPDSLVKARNMGVDLAPLRDWCLRTLAGLGEPGLWVPEASLVAAADALGWTTGAKLFEMPADSIRSLRPGGLVVARQAAALLPFGEGDRADVESMFRVYGQEPPWVRAVDAWSAYERGCGVAGAGGRGMAPALLAAAGLDDEAAAARQTVATQIGEPGAEGDQATAQARPDNVTIEDLAPKDRCSPEPKLQPGVAYEHAAPESAPEELDIDFVAAVAARAVDQALRPLVERYTALTGKLVLPN